MFSATDISGVGTAAGGTKRVKGTGLFVTFDCASKLADALCSCGWGERSLDWDRGERSLLVDPLADVEGGDFVGAGRVEDDLFRGSLTRNLVAMSEVPSKWRTASTLQHCSTI